MNKRQLIYSLLAKAGLLAGANAMAEELKRARVKVDVNFMFVDWLAVGCLYRLTDCMIVTESI